VVEITLSTHSAGGITAKDFALAQQIDELASNQRRAGTAARFIYDLEDSGR
jgi:hypothetical protein